MEPTIWAGQDALARNYGLAAQLNCLNYCHLCKERSEHGSSSSPRWVLADLDRDEIQSLQKAAGEKEIGEAGWRGVLEEVTETTRCAVCCHQNYGTQEIFKFTYGAGLAILS